MKTKKHENKQILYLDYLLSLKPSWAIGGHIYPKRMSLCLYKCKQKYFGDKCRYILLICTTCMQNKTFAQDVVTPR